MPMRPWIACWMFLCLPLAVSAEELKLAPAEIRLDGPRAAQRLVLLAVEDGQATADHTAQARFASTNPAVATVDEAGVVRAVGDGTAVVTARVADQQAAARVTVAGTRETFTPSFRNQVIPILTRLGCNSGACHGALAGKGGLKLSLRGYDPEADHFVLTRQALGRRIDRQAPERSLLLRKPTLVVEHGGGLRVEIGSADFRLLAEWIAAGAPGPRPDDPRLERLEVFPAAALPRSKEPLPVLVRAWYGDGRSADVTHWAKFVSSEEQVASVDEHGRVRVRGSGEAAVSVLYGDLVATARIRVPRANPVDAQVYARSPRNNFIDELVLRKLQALRIPPSGPCTDHEFIRRAYLDAAGILPTPAEVEKFLADPDPKKRGRLIDALLERPEFVDYWAYKWSDLLLVSSRRLPQPAVWSFYQFVRQSVADNLPWDRFARDILTARGSNLHDGAANYFVIHKDVADLTETTALTFLGLSLTCARCHNHPLEKWTQDQYWSMANLFARVGLKNGDRPGEVTVQSQPTGDVRHPRKGLAMPPAPLDGPPLALDSAADRREHFARWLTAAENPYFARALVNRVWRNFLGRGLVEPEDDLRDTNPPSNPELLDALAADFLQHRYDVKHLIRTIMNSATYQRSAAAVAGNENDDRFYSRYLLRRLSAEVILDAYSQVTGVPTPFHQIAVGTSGGVSKYDGYPLGTRALQLPDSLVVSAFLNSFGRPDRSQPCSCERQQDSSVSQALHLNNGQTLNDKLRDKRCRIEAWLQEQVSDEEAVRRLFMLALCRQPTAAEKKKLLDLMAEASQDSGRRQVLEDLFWAVLTGREFLFNR